MKHAQARIAAEDKPHDAVFDATALGGAERALQGVARMHAAIAVLFGGFAVATFFFPWYRWTEVVRVGEAWSDTQEVIHNATGATLAPWHLAMLGVATALCILVAFGKVDRRLLALSAMLYLGAYLLAVQLPNGWHTRRGWPLDTLYPIAGAAFLIAGMGALSTWRTPGSGPRKRLRGSS